MLVTNLVWKKNIVLAAGIGLDVGALRHPGLVVVSAVNLWLGRLDVVSRFCWVAVTSEPQKYQFW